MFDPGWYGKYVNGLKQGQFAGMDNREGPSSMSASSDGNKDVVIYVVKGEVAMEHICRAPVGFTGGLRGR